MCSTLAPNKFEYKHYRVEKYLHWKIGEHYKLHRTEKWYKYSSPPLLGSENVTMLWDFIIYIDCTIQVNRPDIVVVTDGLS